jgi:D-alanyl-D-alanine carboxypeptidase
MSRRPHTLAVLTLLLVPMARASPPAAEAEAHAQAFFQALASGDPEAFERMAQEHFAPELLSRRTPQERRELVERLKADLGALSLSAIRVEAGSSIVLAVSGSRGGQARIEVGPEPAAPHRIARLGIQLGAGEEERGALPPPPISAAQGAREMSRALEGWMADLVARDAFAGVVLVAKNGEAVFEKAYGMANRADGVPHTTATRINLGSINKVFTKVAIGQLVAAGRLALSDTIGKILPDYPVEAARKATVEQLLEHQAGIPDFFGPAFEAASMAGFRSNADYYRFVSTQPLVFEPGAGRAYCNGCYIVLGAIIERVSGTPYEDYVAEHVYKPAGMDGAGPLATDAVLSGVARGYTRAASDGKEALRDNVLTRGAAGSAAGGGYARARDLLALDNALRGGRLLDASMTAWVLGGGPPARGAALGGLRAANRFGIAGGSAGINALLESDGTWTVVVLANLDPPAAVSVGQAMMRALAR